jgi:hypothetical protein
VTFEDFEDIAVPPYHRVEYFPRSGNPNQKTNNPARFSHCTLTTLRQRLRDADLMTGFSALSVGEPQRVKSRFPAITVSFLGAHCSV